ncbi:unnamed protein product [Effrenium voratum]|nr:unnamed protein product [Effrenium voratum]
MAVNGKELAEQLEFLRGLAQVNPELVFKYSELKDIYKELEKTFPDLKHKFNLEKRANLTHYLSELNNLVGEDEEDGQPSSQQDLPSTQDLLEMEETNGREAVIKNSKDGVQGNQRAFYQYQQEEIHIRGGYVEFSGFIQALINNITMKDTVDDHAYEVDDEGGEPYWRSASAGMNNEEESQRENPEKEVEFMLGEDEGGADETKPANEEENTDEWPQHDGMELDELSDKNFGLMKTKVDKMEMEPELRDFFKNQAGGDGSDGEGVEEDDEDDPKPILKNKNKANKWEELSQVGKADDKGSLQKKLLAFKAEITKDEAALSLLLIDMKKEPGKHKEQIVFVKSAIACLETSLKKCEKVLKSGLKKEECKSALIGLLVLWP